MYLDEYKHLEFNDFKKLNYRNIPVVAFRMNDEGMESFNEIYEYLVKQKKLRKIIRCKAGGISVDAYNRFINNHAWDCRQTKSCVEITYISYTQAYRFQFRTMPIEEKINPRRSFGSNVFKVFKDKLLEDGINIEDYAIDNGAQVKLEIESPLIKVRLDTFYDRTFTGVHHIDFHSAWPSCLCEAYPEFRPTIQYFYDHRKDDPTCKDVLNMSIGYMQSVQLCKARWAHLSKAAINGNNKKMLALAEKLIDNDRIVIAYNTDGIWYYGDVYHDENEGDDLCQWHNDHFNCKIRFKSNGSYEYIENKEYCPVVRGYTKLDTVKKRSDWQWGDIYKNEAEPMKYKFIEGKGIVKL